MPPKKDGSSDNVKVMVRVRPFNSKEIAENGGVLPFCTVMAREGVMQASDPDSEENKQEFAFDHVFWSILPDQLEADVPFARQPDVFEHAGLPAIESLFDGFNGCIFAYGQTSSGKTHSMMGYGAEEERGLIPRLCEGLFERIDRVHEACKDLKMTQGKVRKVTNTVTVSYLEIYNERVLDLLTSKREKGDEELKVQFDPVVGPTVKGLKIVEVTSWKEVHRQFDIGSDHRTVAATAMNAVSSRSHAVVQLNLTQVEIVAFIKGKPKIVNRQSRLNLVDLAGSEKVQKSMVSGQGLKEAIGINQSLTCLGRVIDGLVKGDKHVPYRDSVLTQLLSDSLGGNSRTTMLACISPAAINYEETLSTLRYASRARQIVNVVKVNEDPTAQLIRELQEELAQMRMGIVEGVVSGSIVGESGRAASNEAVKEVEDMLAQLEVRETEAKRKLQEQEGQWAQERAVIEQGHTRAVNALEEEREALMVEQLALRKKTTQLESQVQAHEQAKGLMQQKHEEAQAEAQKKQDALRRQRVIDRFRQATDKTRQLQQKDVINREIFDLKRVVTDLEEELVARDKELAARPPKHHGMYIGQAINRESATPMCEMCYECNAVRICQDCGGDYLCELCDYNQHRSSQTRSHQRVTIDTGLTEGVIVCEYCGVKRATWTCAECINGRLCEDCDDIKHRNKKRNFHHRFPGVNVAPGPGPLVPAIMEGLPNPYASSRPAHTIATPTYPWTKHERIEETPKWPYKGPSSGVYTPSGTHPPPPAATQPPPTMPPPPPSAPQPPPSPPFAQAATAGPMTPAYPTASAQPAQPYPLPPPLLGYRPYQPPAATYQGQSTQPQMQASRRYPTLSIIPNSIAPSVSASAPPPGPQLYGSTMAPPSVTQYPAASFLPTAAAPAPAYPRSIPTAY